jgi:predicted Fe-S protein YdhL (DUF1289 family)
MDTRSGFCLGCFRTLQEIAQWTKMTHDEKKSVVRECEERERKANKGNCRR